MAYLILHPPPWIFYPALVVLAESLVGHRYGCVIKAPPGFECDLRFALPMPIYVGSPLRESLGWFVPAGLLFLLVQSAREAFDETVKAGLDRFFGRIVHADPFALLGTQDQRGVQPLGWQGLLEGQHLHELDETRLRAEVERAFVLVQQAWARQDARVARTVMTTDAWQALSIQIDYSRRFRRGGITLVGLETGELRIARTGFMGSEPAAMVRVRVTCSDPVTDCEQDWTLVRPRDQEWLVAAVEPVAQSRPPARGGRLE
ncbi:MAG TPA: hypothetical protein VF160_04435 [Candidatus Dormibacteraeota bacterium]